MMIKDAIEGHLEVIAEKGKKRPAPKKFNSGKAAA
jgi:predicted RNase H-like HicB family nuclease